MSAIARYFQFADRETTLGREVRGGVTTFLTMAYILVANPVILSNAGIAPTAVATSTALAAGICCVLMGLYANFPLALASGMGLNALVAFQLAGPAGTGSWQTAMGLIVLNGVLILLLVLAGLREAVLNAIPRDLRIAIGAGIGLFIAVIGLQFGEIVVDHPATFVTHGNLGNPRMQIAVFGLVLTAVLMSFRVTGALLIGVVACAVLAAARGLTSAGDYKGPDFSAMFQADVLGALQWRFLPLLMAVMMVDFFDTLGTVSAVAEQGKLVDGRGKIPRVRRILAIDSVSASVGGALGASSVTAYVESAAGVSEGARTGLSTVVVGVLFLVAIFLAPFAGLVPQYAVAPALILVGFLMMTSVAEIDFKNLPSALPAFVTLVTIPLTFSIAHGIGFGLILYVILNVARGQFRQVHPLLYVVAAAFAGFLVLEARG